MKTNIKKIYLWSLAIALTYILLSFSLFPKKIISASLTGVKDTLSNSQLSYFARLGVGTSAGQSSITIALTDNPSNTTNNLFAGDTLAIGTGTTITGLTNYIVNDIGNTATIQLTTGIGSSNAVVGATIIATRSAIHTVAFTPQSILSNGTFEVLIKTTDISGETINDGIPDQGGFDLGQDVGTTIGLGTRVKDDDITCPTISGAVWTKSISTVVLSSGTTYYSFACAQTSGAGDTNALTAYTMTIGRDLATGSQLINPAPAISHTEGQASPNADTYSFYVRHLDSTDDVIDITQGRVAVVESVRVTATVDPSLTFTIDATGVGVGTTPCGITLDAAAVNTTATQVNFGSLSLAVFNDLAQRLSCVTNASDGYVVTAFTNTELTNINTGVTIPHTDCDAGTCTQISEDPWVVDNSTSGFGYSIQNIDADTVDFAFGGSPNFAAKPFGDGYSNARMIFQNTSTPASTERIYMCYRLTVSTAQEAGEYENGITYTATSTF